MTSEKLVGKSSVDAGGRIINIDTDADREENYIKKQKLFFRQRVVKIAFEAG